ncbi:MAG: hypothetical protein N2317_06300 [Syntrophales bacterium]|nr:hypothetical protein [Syntrophales bacterium]
MDRLLQVYNTYYNKVMDWYSGLTFVEQFFALFALFVLLFAVVALFIVKKVSS